jgi:hypothetical protein
MTSTKVDSIVEKTKDSTTCIDALKVILAETDIESKIVNNSSMSEYYNKESKSQDLNFNDGNICISYIDDKVTHILFESYIDTKKYLDLRKTYPNFADSLFWDPESDNYNDFTEEDLLSLKKDGLLDMSRKYIDGEGEEDTLAELLMYDDINMLIRNKFFGYISGKEMWTLVFNFLKENIKRNKGNRNAVLCYNGKLKAVFKEFGTDETCKAVMNEIFGISGSDECKE